MAKIVIFSYSKGHGEHNTYTEEIEFDDDATEEDIREEYEQWVWEQIGDYFTWYYKEPKEDSV